MATPIDWSKFNFNGKVLSGYGGNPLGGTYGSWWDQGNAQPGAVTPWGTTIGADVSNPGTLNPGNVQSYDQFLNLQGAQQALGENQKYEDGKLLTNQGESGWVVDPNSNTDGNLYQYQPQLELNSGFHRYDLNDFVRDPLYKDFLTYAKGENLFSYDPQWGVVARDSDAQNRITDLISTIHPKGEGSNQALARWAITAATMGAGAALSAGAAGAGAGADAATAGAGVADAASGASNIFGSVGDSIFGGYMPGSELANTIGNVSGFNPYDAWSVTGGINGTGNSVLGNLFSNPSIFGENPFSFGGGAGTPTTPSLWDQVKSIYNSPEAEMAKTIASGTQSALNAAQQAGLLGGGQAQAGGGGGSMGLLGAQSGGRGRSFAELSPYARGLLRG